MYINDYDLPKITDAKLDVSHIIENIIKKQMLLMYMPFQKFENKSRNKVNGEHNNENKNEHYYYYYYYYYW